MGGFEIIFQTLHLGIVKEPRIRAEEVQEGVYTHA